jgi:hypothetical protein
MENKEKFYLSSYISAAGIILRNYRGVNYDFYSARDDDKVRLVTEECGVANQVVIRARVRGAEGFSELKTLTGQGSILVDISTYDEIQLEVVNLDAPSGRFKLIASGFSVAGGDITVSAPFGMTSEGTTQLNFTSDDNTVTISGDGEGGIDLSVNSISGANFKPEQVRVLTSTDIALKSITLNVAPTSPNLVQVFVAGGPMQVYGTDFLVVGQSLTWNLLGLDGELEAGDQLVIMYN